MARHPTFLIVDDSEDNRFLSRHALLKAFPAGQVIEAETAQEALQATAHNAFNGVIADHHLGEVDGVEFVHELRAAGVQCPVVMATASSDPRVHRRAYQAGAAHVFANGGYEFVTYFKEVLHQATAPS